MSEEKVETNAVAEEKKGLSITSLILGIASFIFMFINTWVALLCSILAIVFGAIGRKKGAKGMGTAGLVLGIVAAVITVILIIVALGIVMSAMSQLM